MDMMLWNEEEEEIYLGFGSVVIRPRRTAAVYYILPTTRIIIWGHPRQQHELRQEQGCNHVSHPIHVAKTFIPGESISPSSSTLRFVKEDLPVYRPVYDGSCQPGVIDIERKIVLRR